MNAPRGPRRFGLTAALLLLATMAGHHDGFAGQLTLTWGDNSADETGFAVERRTGATGPFAEIAVLGPGAMALTDRDLADATTYCYRVRAFNAVAYSDYSNEACGSTPQMFGLAVVKMGGGTGRVLSTPSGIACGASCSGKYAGGTVVSLSAAPGTSSLFTGWGGACTGTGPCTVKMNGAAVVTAAFDGSIALSVSKTGTGSGKVKSAPAGIKCGATCSASYAASTPVTLTATPAAGHVFNGWSGGGCTGTGGCTVTLSAATTVTAAFDAVSYALSVNKAGTGVGKIVSAPAGIKCGPTCSASYPASTAVTLTPKPGAGYVFAGWSGGGCTGMGPCTVTLSAATAVTAAFDVASATRAGGGSGESVAASLAE
jgi:Divergent InlB B-repeat domain